MTLTVVGFILVIGQMRKLRPRDNTLKLAQKARSLLEAEPQLELGCPDSWYSVVWLPLVCL